MARREVYWKDGDLLETDAAFFKNSDLIKIHPSYWDLFPPVLPAGSKGRLVTRKGDEMFVQFLLPGKTEYLKNCSVYFTVRMSQSGGNFKVTPLD